MLPGKLTKKNGHILYLNQYKQNKQKGKQSEETSVYITL